MQTGSTWRGAHVNAPVGATRPRIWPMPISVTTAAFAPGWQHDTLRVFLSLRHLGLEPRQRTFSAWTRACAPGAWTHGHVLRAVGQLVTVTSARHRARRGSRVRKHVP